jgi:bud site selection protein 20
MECAKYYESALALATHTRSKVHKRRIKDLKAGAYTHEENARAAGQGAADNRQRGVEDIVRRFETATVDVAQKEAGHVQPEQKEA